MYRSLFNAKKGKITKRKLEPTRFSNENGMQFNPKKNKRSEEFGAREPFGFSRIFNNKQESRELGRHNPENIIPKHTPEYIIPPNIHDKGTNEENIVRSTEDIDFILHCPKGLEGTGYFERVHGDIARAANNPIFTSDQLLNAVNKQKIEPKTKRESPKMRRLIAPKEGILPQDSEGSLVYSGYSTPSHQDSKGSLSGGKSKYMGDIGTYIYSSPTSSQELSNHYTPQISQVKRQ